MNRTPHSPQRLVRLGVVAGQLAVVVFAIWLFKIESAAFLRVSILVLFGFVIHDLLPMRWRITFFLALSAVGFYLVLGAANAGWLFAIGLSLIGICHLPLAFGARVAMLIGLGTTLAIFRAGYGSTPWSLAIWPILGAMFMFRLIIYMYDLRHDPSFSWRWTLSYFFMLPTVCFPLFPVVDFRKFRTYYYDEESHLIYQRGVLWLVTGLTHILAYRFVYQNMAISAQSVTSLGTFVLYVSSSFLLYLRVSGNFHMIVGILLLFGFNLPRTNRYYLVPGSFTDFWRRANIYWKDFMMKVFYYPVYFKLRKRGATTALVLSTAVVFATTAFLHSYQWFWLLGASLSRWEEALFWSIFFVFVLINVLQERRRGERSRSRLVKTLFTAGTSSFVFLLWSMWTSDSLVEWLGLWSAAGPWSWLLAAIPVVFYLAGLLCARAERGRENVAEKKADSWEEGPPFWRSVAQSTAVLAVVLGLGSPFVVSFLGTRTAGALESLWLNDLNRRDEVLLERGYYEHLTGSPWQNPELLELYSKRPASWLDIEETEAYRATDDFMMGELLPDAEVMLRGALLETNRWGMRDRDYEKKKAPGTFRFALLGASHTMGAGVENQETFEALLEGRLNSTGELQAERVEILNFAVGGRFTIRQVAVLEKQVFSFEPDAVIVAAHRNDPLRAARDLQRIVRGGVDIPYEGLRAIVDESGAVEDMPEVVASRLLDPYGPASVGWAYEKIAAESRRHGAVPVWLFMPHSSGPETEAEFELLANLAESAGFVFLDVSDAFEGQDEQDLRVAPWDGHPNALAHQLIADRFYEVLMEGGLAAIAPGQNPAE